jgi:hypothetical protein
MLQGIQIGAVTVKHQARHSAATNATAVIAHNIRMRVFGKKLHDVDFCQKNPGD